MKALLQPLERSYFIEIEGHFPLEDMEYLPPRPLQFPRLRTLLVYGGDYAVLDIFSSTPYFRTAFRSDPEPWALSELVANPALKAITSTNLTGFCHLMSSDLFISLLRETTQLQNLVFDPIGSPETSIWGPPKTSQFNSPH